MPTKIRYNGTEIATVAAGESKILECSGRKMRTNVAVEMPSEYIIPEGTATITENGTFDVTQYASAEVNVPSEEPILEEITITENGEYTPSGDGYSKVTVEVEGGGGDATFNIAYGDIEPTDTSKLWVKTSEPSAVQVTSNPVFTGEELEAGIATLPTAADSIASAVVGTKVYLFGGWGSSSLSTINVFDTESNTITTLSTTLPTTASNIASAVVGTKVYLFGGYSGSYLSTINVFDTEDNTITTLSTRLPKAAYSISSAVVGTKVYLFGGQGSSSYLSTINVFDTESNTITTLSTTLPTTTYGIASAAVGTKVYLFGGWGSSKLSTINVFDTETNTIETLSATLPTATYGISSATVGTKIYLFGGEGSSGLLSTINVFDTESNTITTLSTTLPTAAQGIASAAVGTKVYLFGGLRGSRLSTINAFTVALALASNNLLIEATLVENIFNLLSNVEIGVKNVYLGNADGVGERVDAALYVDGAWANI